MSGCERHAGLQIISSLFSYPEVQTDIQLQENISSAEGILAEMNSFDHILLENEYVRLFINAMPEVPCAPYGSVYLEGSVMGESTLKVAGIYLKYGIESTEPADHIAVESEFLAWLHGRTAGDADARKDFHYLLGHLRKWTDPFFNKVEQHDRLGYYRLCAKYARRILEDME
ncbi:MAG: hypothetical protein ACD_75C00938G0005 [uncultured bacterium]|nr:MAG: hypothetical protein ACD_75C00938G0005 [uncultured bacterium]HBG18975.1 hypothetical protein [Desulfobulbaceae bacterium]